MVKKPRGLGRGLDALLATSNASRDRDDQQPEPQAAASTAPSAKEKELRRLPVEQLRPGKYQPRRDMVPDALEELASSIRAQGIIQPIVVRPVGPEQFEIIAGERRWRAAQMAELELVPCVVREVPDEAAVAIALIENIQREDLNAMEEAVALKRLMAEFELTHQEVADAVGKSRTAVTNLLRLNSLNDDVKRLLEHGDIEMGHARALLALSGDVQSETARLVAGKGLSVRETEKLVKKVLEGKPAKVEKPVDPDIRRLETTLSERFGAKVAIDNGPKGKGKVTISYGSLDELDGILAHLGVETS
ncbi:ParB/RepB/Spo0J family partition protein [Gallaecimonas pentaromativorans]|uniref:Probable chromosome-partitioning protein ParB n=1 Tax=Gallaecimonas pentaromativorans TaxID=584787 RepID=A0A3N1NSI6_9GAMM|nr:ParB/RepB/Spo0J family partition protein [Gallaecimonas pentaromativorans]MED5526775.1 ParB/RepB/Spo0J family partition protein [Pseudomonadota bacterium]ROQ19145.1 ParB family chromosome partitioning protein [Gallaecimonas pentaromativorans]